MTLSAAELEREVLDAPRRSIVPLADTTVIERPGWLQLLTPSLKQGGLNEVAWSVLSHEEADAVIDATLEQYARAGLRFRWAVTPDARPLDLAERLARRGMLRSETRAMYRDTSSTPAGGELAVRQVQPGELELFTDLMAQGWRMDPGPLRAVNEAMLRSPRHPLFLAWAGTTPVATAGMVLQERSAYLLGAVVLPAWRRRGAYRALVAHRLEVARAAGLTLATVHARAETSAPLLERMGFRELARYPTFSNRP